MLRPFPGMECLAELLLHRCKHESSASTAIFDDISALTYHELYENVEVFSRQLEQKLSHEPSRGKVLIGIHLPRSIAYIVSVLVAVKTRCAFVPLTIENPPDRTKFILRDAGVRYLITDKPYYYKLNLHSAGPPLDSLEYLAEKNSRKVQFIDLANQRQCKTWEQESNLSADICYVIYTSGSTGKPKGIAIRESGLTNVVRAQISLLDLGPNDIVGQFASIGFDASLSEIFTALLSGATLAVLKNEQRLGKDLVETLKRYNVTTITLPPSLLALFDPTDFPTLSKIISAGEACPKRLGIKWHQAGKTFFNGYGPSETTICATMYRVTNETSTIDPSCAFLPIGSPIAGVTTHVL